MQHNQNNSNQWERLFIRSFEFFVEAIGWLQIVASPLILGLIIGFIVLLSTPGILGLILGGIIALSGLIIGIVWANKQFKGKGTIAFMSRSMATPELEPKNDPEGKEQSNKP